MSVGEWEVELWLGNNGSAKVRTQLFNTQTFFKFKPFKADNKKGGNRLKQGMVSKQYPDCEYMVSITWILGLQSPQCMFWQIYADTYFLWAKKEKTKNSSFGKSSVQLKGGALIDTEVIKVHYMDGQGREGPVWCTLNSHITTLNFHITIHNLQFTTLNSQLSYHNSQHTDGQTTVF